MWIFTTEGFVSAVEHRHGANSLMVRARSKHALLELSRRTSGVVEQSPDADYPFRLTVSREVFSQWLSAEVSAINYFNFKDAAHALGDRRYDRALMSVWSAMYESEPDDSRGSK